VSMAVVQLLADNLTHRFRRPKFRDSYDQIGHLGEVCVVRR